ncbi:MAG TPA: helix-turn-helix domain-containing protein [Clostridia bacterium]|nr:helix-turn-helix domain-containing protein [Clostridia bacterium]
MAGPSREAIRRRLRRTELVREGLGRDLRRLRVDAGLTMALVADAAGISRSHLNEIELGRGEASTAVLVAVSDVLGADLTTRVYPTTGPAIRDRFQALIGEELLRIAHGSWRRLTEVPVHRPARGRIDVVLQRIALALACEIHSQVRRLEQQLGWATLKAESLPSADFWRTLQPEPEVSRLLILRSTHATREIAIRFEQTLRTAYPAPAGAVHAALVDGAPWPGPGLLWADVEGDRARILDRPPRTVGLGR